MKTNFLFILISILLLFTACEQKPVPTDKLDYVGEWRADNMYLVIQQDGSIYYKRVNGNYSKSLNNIPITEFKGDDFIAGVLTWKTTFVVNQVPKEVNGTWLMTVDGVKLKRITTEEPHSL